MKKVIILIDGQNLFYCLKDIGVIEKKVKWDALFKHLLEPEDELIRTYWFRPQRILDSYFTHANIKNQIVYKQFQNYYQAFLSDPSGLPSGITTQIDTKVVEAENWLKNQKDTFARIEYNYDQLSLEYGDIEFVKTGIVKVNPYLQEFIGEKGVDIALAVKMIALSVDNKCDKIILISGDFDYAEAIKYVKNNMTKIHIVRLHKGIPPKNRSVSRDLAILSDRVLDLYESDIKTNFLK
ncbi:MAG TPA: NYN domain-containing protein [Bacteroidales bacterium]|nr:NYN domain-containing protein [Bacteroidales bacterium]